jgi:hypothetical protein
MLNRLCICLAFLALPSVALALPAAPNPTAQTTVSGALFDKVTKNTNTSQVNKNQDLLGYTLDAHDNNYAYEQPLCATVGMVEADGTSIASPNSFVMGDTLSLTIRPNGKAGAPPDCISRIVRQAISRGPSGGECLQNYQVKHSIDGNPSPLNIQTEYSITVKVYTRPTIDCDGQAYGAAPITSVVAQNKPFTVWLTRKNDAGTLELARWSITTNATGQASFPYTFSVANDSYQFHMTPTGNAAAGDEIDWNATVTDPNGSPTASPSPVATSGGTTPKLSLGVIVGVMFALLLGAGFAEYLHWVRKRTRAVIPEQEYLRTPKI